MTDSGKAGPEVAMLMKHCFVVGQTNTMSASQHLELGPVVWRCWTGKRSQMLVKSFWKAFCVHRTSRGWVHVMKALMHRTEPS